MYPLSKLHNSFFHISVIWCQCSASNNNLIQVFCNIILQDVVKTVKASGFSSRSSKALEHMANLSKLNSAAGITFVLKYAM